MDDDTVHLGTGGPFYRLERASHLPLLGVAIVAIAITWVPLIVLALAAYVTTHRVAPLIGHLSVHSRLLVALPLLIIGQRELDRGAGAAVSRLFAEGYLTGRSAVRARERIHAIDQLCASVWPEVVMLALGVVLSVSGLFVSLRLPGVGHAVPRQGITGLWFYFVSLPVFQFVLWRSLFRWLLWARLLFDVARLPLRLLPTHADGHGGIAFLKMPSMVYGAILLFAVSSVLCAGWADEVRVHGAELAAIRSLFIVFVVVGTLVAFGPLLLLSPQLVRAWDAGHRDFEGLLSDYSRRFEHRWFAPASRPDDVLGTPDAQTLADLGGAYRETVARMQPLLIGPRDVVTLFIVSQLPAIPLLLMRVPAREVLTALLRLATGTGVG